MPSTYAYHLDYEKGFLERLGSWQEHCSEFSRAQLLLKYIEAHETYARVEPWAKPAIAYARLLLKKEGRHG